MEHGFIRVASAIPSVKVADCNYNAKSIVKMLKIASEKNVEIVSFPELSLTSYTCGDLFHQEALIESAEKELYNILRNTHVNNNIIGIVGLPVKSNNQLFNCAVVFQSHKILGVVPKTFLPNYSEFYEKRWFASSLDLNKKSVTLCDQTVPFGTDIIFEYRNANFAIEICEDVWTTIPPSSYHALNGANLIFNLSASNEVIGKNNYLKSLISQQSARCIAGYVYTSSGFGESSTDLVFAGNAIIAENGSILSQSERFSFDEQIVVNEIDIDRLMSDRRKNGNFMLGITPLKQKEDYQIVECRDINIFSSEIFNRNVKQLPFVPSGKELDERCDEIFNIQVSALAKRLTHINCKSVTIGISGGLDSTLALLVVVKTFDKLNIPRKNIIGITMPGFGTTGRTYNNSLLLMQNLGITSKEISIKDACIQHFKDIEHDMNAHDVTYENVQARERTQILMDVSNKYNSIVVGTGDLSELALGWATYNGDHMSMYGVNTGVPKTLVKFLVKYVSESIIETEEVRNILADVLDTPVSPELLPTNDKGEIVQKTEDIVGPYELHDFFLYYMVRFGFSPSKIFFLAKQAFKDKYDDKVILKWLHTFYKRFFAQQFKRSCLPDGPKVGSINLSPRGDWRMPSDASGEIWIKEVEKMM